MSPVHRRAQGGPFHCVCSLSVVTHWATPFDRCYWALFSAGADLPYVIYSSMDERRSCGECDGWVILSKVAHDVGEGSLLSLGRRARPFNSKATCCRDAWREAGIIGRHNDWLCCFGS